MRVIKTGKPLSEKENESLQTYLQEIGRTKELTDEQEKALSSRVLQGDEQAAGQLIQANLRFVVSVAKRYQDRGMGMNDLISEGNMGLVKAAHKFDAAKGLRFVQYAVFFIREAIENAIKEQSGIYPLPHKMNDPKEIRQSQPFSVDAPLVEGKQMSLLHVLSDPDEIAPDQQLLADGLREGLINSLDVLDGRELKVIRLFYGLDNTHASLTYEEIGKEMGLKRERVRDIRKKAERKLKKHTDSEQLRAYLK